MVSERKPAARIISLGVLVIVAALAVWIASQSKSRGRSRLLRASATFAGYTNDASGARLAVFVITNLSDLSVARMPYCVVSAATPIGEWNTHSAVALPGPARKCLHPGESETLVLVPPTARSAWKVSFYLTDEVGPGWTLKRWANAALQSVRLTPRFGAVTYQVDSRRIEGPP